MDAGNFRTVLEEVAANSSYKFENPLPDRPGFNTAGKAIAIRVNQYKVAQFPQKDVYQYDVSSPSLLIL